MLAQKLLARRRRTVDAGTFFILLLLPAWNEADARFCLKQKNAAEPCGFASNAQYSAAAWW
jgi:hypothetical protein